MKAFVSAFGKVCLLGLLYQVGPLLPAQAQTTRLAVLSAENRRAQTPADLATIRSGVRSGDPQTVRVAVRALGRLERPSLIPDIVPSLKNALPEIRAEAANAVGQAAQGWKDDQPAGAATALGAATSALVARLRVETEPDVRAAICETLGRLPYTNTENVAGAEQALVEMFARVETVTDRLGVAKGFEALIRLHQKHHEPSAEAIALLKRLSTSSGPDAALGTRIRRLALEALIAAGSRDEELLAAVVRDPDAQVRAIAMRAAPPGLLEAGLADESPIVRFEALRQVKGRYAESGELPPAWCSAALAAVTDRDTHVALLALDELAGCGSMPEAVAVLDRAVTDLSGAGSARGWHRAAHGLVALAEAAPERGAVVLAQFTQSRIWQLRMYAARAATKLKHRQALERLAADDDDNVREAAIDGLRRVAGHDADAICITQLSRNGYQVVRAAASSLVDTPRRDEAIPALKAALQRLVAEGRDNSHDARAALVKALTSLGEKPHSLSARLSAVSHSEPGLTADNLRRLVSPRARVTIRGVGAFELALFTAQAPAAVGRFAHLAEAGYYNGLTFHRVAPNFVIQGGSPGANEYIGDARFMRDEVGLWPHVRGAVGISTRGHDTGDAQIFIDLVDNPRLDHQYTVFAQVLNGIEVVDQILEGDIIDRIEIIPGQ